MLSPSRETNELLLTYFKAKHLVETWTLDYLQESVPEKLKWLVKESTDPFFLYSDPAKNKSGHPFKTNVTVNFMEFNDFIKSYKDTDKEDRKWYYFQTELKEQVGPTIIKDFQKSDFAWLKECIPLTGNGSLTTNVLFIGQKGVITPNHYDERYNFFSQLQGRKRFTLFSPKYFDSLYPYPVGHAADRQSQVSLYNPDLDKFPKFANVSGLQTTLNPGDVLYLPEYWWHHVESIYEDTISLSYWFAPRPELVSIQACLMQKPLKDETLRVILHRNAEEFLGDKIGWKEAAAVFKAMDTSETHPKKAMLLNFLSLFFLESEAKNFAKELVDNRFKHIIS